MSIHNIVQSVIEEVIIDPANIGETITYNPQDGTSYSFNAVIDRHEPEYVSEDEGTRVIRRLTVITTTAQVTTDSELDSVTVDGKEYEILTIFEEPNSKLNMECILYDTVEMIGTNIRTIR